MAENWGLKVSVDGKSINSTNDLDIAFTNGSKLLKVALTGSGSYTSGLKTIAHNLGYIPQFLAFMTDNSTGHTTFCDGTISDGGVAFADSTNLYLGSLGASTYRYYIFYESIDGVTHTTNVSTNNYGVKVMLPGNSYTSLDLSKQSLNSEKNNLKIAKKGIQTVSGSGIGWVNIAHGLSYRPSYMLWHQTSGSGKYYSSDLTAYTDNTYLSVYVGSGSVNLTLNYILFVETPI